MFIVAVIAGSIIMSLLGRYPFAGPIIAGMVCTFILKNEKDGAAAAFISGSFTGVFAGLLLTLFGTLLGLLTFGILGGAVAGLVSSIMATGKFISAIYFGFLGALGAFLGGTVKRKLLN